MFIEILVHSFKSPASDYAKEEKEIMVSTSHHQHATLMMKMAMLPVRHCTIYCRKLNQYETFVIGMRANEIGPLPVFRGRVEAAYENPIEHVILLGVKYQRKQQLIIVQRA